MPRPSRYTDIAESLEARIHKGEFKAGDKLPTHYELCAEYQVGYTTVAKAIAILRDRGLVYGIAPLGVFVAD
ncbi:hypothetical protein Rhe02_55170 [Rhizocola hellebori]|uniref:HTH gntR-type domain-containing protein n=1 Tax=Rhizocola hellebori TaxID=1392758 RepID=A0A8J3VIC1_9ACTN|nr:winged helix-turn-helix domain-containing protein [Rhizocola hellebori]GIH07450.1 hypothetical protein Rhe02_55170 [Rhizocola hellebori]